MNNLKSLIVIVFSMVMLYSCQGNNGLTLDPAQEKSTIDSTLTARTELLRDSIARLCEQRLENEVPYKVDSLVQAQVAGTE